MLEAVRQQHQQERVLLAMEQHQQKLLQSKAAHTAGCAAVTRANEVAVRQAQRVHAVAVQQVQEENKRRVGYWAVPSVYHTSQSQPPSPTCPVHLTCTTLSCLPFIEASHYCSSVLLRF